MIEIVKENGVSINKRKMPVNIRAFGSPDGSEVIYIEDYVETFMKQVAIRDDHPKVLILYGEKKELDEHVGYFVYGAIQAEDSEVNNKTVFGEGIWREVNRKAGHYFPEASILGWAYIRYDLDEFVEEKVILTHKEFFRSEQKVFIEYSAIEKQECMFLMENGEPKLQNGHYIYYESNEAMQNYMITIKQDEPLEVKPEVDLAAKKCRGVVRERKEEIKHKQTAGVLYGSSMAMLLVVTIVGITLFNNYNKMQDMEKVLYDISNQMSKEVDDVSKPVEISAQDDEYASEKECVEKTDEEEPAVDVSENSSLILATNEEPQKGVNIVSDLAPEIVDNTDPITVIDETDKITMLDEDATEGNTTYMIEKGDTLSKISLKFYGDESKVDQICMLNQIEDKNSIQYGVNIVLP